MVEEVQEIEAKEGSPYKYNLGDGNKERKQKPAGGEMIIMPFLVKKSRRSDNYKRTSFSRRHDFLKNNSQTSRRRSKTDE